MGMIGMLLMFTAMLLSLVGTGYGEDRHKIERPAQVVFWAGLFMWFNA